MDYKVFKYHLQDGKWILDGGEIHYDCYSSVEHWRSWLAFNYALGLRSVMFLRGDICTRFQSISSDGQNKIVWKLIEE